MNSENETIHFCIDNTLLIMFPIFISTLIYYSYITFFFFISLSLFFFFNFKILRQRFHDGRTVKILFSIVNFTLRLIADGNKGRKNTENNKDKNLRKRLPYFLKTLNKLSEIKSRTNDEWCLATMSERRRRKKSRTKLLSLFFLFFIFENEKAQKFY